jgi:type VI secretion system protein ImpH
MATALGRETDAVAFFAALAAAPYNYDFYQALRRIECLYADKPRWGRALRPMDEPVRLGQDPDLSFAPAPLASFETSPDGRPPRLQVRLFGLTGPNGPLPIHITEYARERLRHAGDPTLTRFLDLLNHRFLAFFYRAWAQAQPHVNRDRPKDDRFAAYIGSFVGVTPAAFRHRDSLPDLAKFFHAGTLIRHVRNAEGITSILQQFFRVPVQVEQFVGHWLRLGTPERTQLGAATAALGTGAVAGNRVWDRQHKFRVHLGPLSLAQYESFLPGGSPLRKLVDWIRLYLCYELDWDVRLVLKKDEVPRLALGRRGKLGWTTWLGERRAPTDAGDLRLNAEAFVDRTKVSAA